MCPQGGNSHYATVSSDSKATENLNIFFVGGWVFNMLHIHE